MSKTTKVLLTLLFLAIVNPATIAGVSVFLLMPEAFSQEHCEGRGGVWHRSSDRSFCCKISKLDK